MRLIDADALILSFCDSPDYSVSMFKKIQRRINAAQAIDAVPVVRGEWVEKSYVHEYANETSEERRYVVCGNCGKQPPVGFGKVNFCHNCGADMRGSEVKE